MSFLKLKNPKSTLYYEVKEFIKSGNFPWFFIGESHTVLDTLGDYQSPPYYGHKLLTRPGSKNMPGKLYPEVTSDCFDAFYPLIEEIILLNDIKVSSLLRLNVNCVHPQQDTRLSLPHVDHDIPHKNMLIYLTDAGGETVLFDDEGNKEYYHPEEDDIVLFEGVHCMRPPKDKRRIVIICTFF